MDLKTSISLPIIDFLNSDLKPGTPAWDSVKSQVWKAAEEYGCFKALFNTAPRELRDRMNESLKELFDLSLLTKRRNVSGKPLHGYIGSYPDLPLYESMAINGPENYDNVESFTNVVWSEGNISFSETVHSFSKQVTELDQMIRRMILERLGVEKYLNEHMNSTYYALRLIRYKGPQTNEKQVGLKPHADQNIVTILHQNEVDGLELQTKDGEWIDVKYLRDSFNVVIGESLNAWTNGRLYCPCHRVMMTGNKTRYSAVMFSVPKDGYKIKAPEELVDEEHPLLFKPFEYFELLKMRYTGLHQMIARESALKTNPGV